MWQCHCPGCGRVLTLGGPVYGTPVRCPVCLATFAAEDGAPTSPLQPGAPVPRRGDVFEKSTRPNSSYPRDFGDRDPPGGVTTSPFERGATAGTVLSVAGAVNLVVLLAMLLTVFANTNSLTAVVVVGAVLALVYLLPVVFMFYGAGAFRGLNSRTLAVLGIVMAGVLAVEQLALGLLLLVNLLVVANLGLTFGLLPVLYGAFLVGAMACNLACGGCALIIYRRPDVQAAFR
jgi:hypothetical protein